jgi:hypothetical protein
MDPTHPNPPESEISKISAKKTGAPGEAPPGPDSRALAQQLGLSEDDLKSIRDELLEPFTHWIPGKPIHFTLAGVAAVRAFVGLDGADASTARDSGPPGASAAPEKKNAERVTLIVIRPAKGNDRIVLCHELDAQGAPLAGPQVRLQTRTNKNFTKGMRVPNCVRSQISPTYFTFEGRSPRWKGRF